MTLRHKYRAVPTELDGIKFPSKAEAAYFQVLTLAKRSGQLLFFLRQVPIAIPGSTYRLDYMEFWANGEIIWTDVKGFETEAFRVKRRAVEALYPFKIRTVTLKNGRWVEGE